MSILLSPRALSPRVLNEARRQASFLATRMTTAYQQRRLGSWADLEKMFSIVVPSPYSGMPWNYATFSQFRDFWKISFEARLQASTLTTSVEAPREKLKVEKHTSHFASLKLYPEQEPVYRSIRDDLFSDNSTVYANIQDGDTGSGKMYVGAALCAYLIFEKKILDDPMIKFRPHPIIIFSPKPVCEQWHRVLGMAGLEEYVNTRKIFVFSLGELTTMVGDMFVNQVEDIITGEVSLVWNPVLTPYCCIVDESHNFIRHSSTRTKKLWAMFKASLQTSKGPTHPRTVFFSATPGEKVNDFKTYVLGIRTFTYQSMVISNQNWKYFASLMDNNPDRPNIEGVRRLRKVLSPYIKSFPYVKPRFKPINLIWMVDFSNDSHKRIYQSAHERYLEVCEKAGKNTNFGGFEKAVALMNYRKTVEPLRVDPISERIARNYVSGKLATAVGTAFKETIAGIVFRLVDKYQIPREKISIIWGGRKQFNKTDILSTEEQEAIKKGGLNLLVGNPQLVKKVKLTLKYIEDQFEHDETSIEQAYRHDQLKALRLTGVQSDNARQMEIDNFQDGTSVICLYTIAAGGVGLSLDRDKEFLLPREGIYTPLYNGKEFKQGIGRLVRRASLSDAYQYICMMRGTVEETHVAPILDNKLRCIGELTNRKLSLSDALDHHITEADLARLGHTSGTILRDMDEAEKDAEADDTKISNDVETEDDDNLSIEEIKEELETV